MTSTPEDPFARDANSGQQSSAQQSGGETWGDAPPPPPPSPSQGQPQYGQPQYAQPPQGQPQYGQPQYAQPPQYGQPPAGPTGPRPGTEKNWMGITSLVLSLVGLFTWITAIAGIVLGHLGRGAAKRGEADNGGLSLAGLIIGYVVVALGLLSIIAAVVFFGFLVAECGGNDPAVWCTESSASAQIESIGALAGLAA